MSKRKTIISSLILLFCMLFSFSVSAAPMSGDCGESATYVLDGSILTLSGSGVIDDDTGWFDYFDTVETLIVSEGITELDSRIFEGFEVLSSVSLPSTLTKIGARAFRDCSTLDRIVIPDSVKSISSNSFSGCDNLVIICTEGSYAESYAITYSIPYEHIKDVTVTFDANGGTNAPKALSGSLVNTFVIPNNKPSKTDSVFMGWATKADATIVEYAVGESFNVSGDTTLYAVWLQCTITSETTESEVYINASIASPDLTLYVAAYNGLEFADVFMKPVKLSAGLNKISTGLDWSNLEKNLIKVFLWDSEMSPYANAFSIAVKEKFAVTFVDYNGTTLSEQIVVEGEDAIVPASPSRDGYVFKGWNGNISNVTEARTISATYVEADKNNMLVVGDAYGSVGDVVTIPVTLGGNVALCGYEVELFYDTSLLRYVSHKTGSNVMAGTSGQSIKANYVSDTNTNIDKGMTIFNVTFEIIGTPTEDITMPLTILEVTEDDGTGAASKPTNNYSVVNGVIHIQ